MLRKYSFSILSIRALTAMVKVGCVCRPNHIFLPKLPVIYSESKLENRILFKAGRGVSTSTSYTQKLVKESTFDDVANRTLSHLHDMLENWADYNGSEEYDISLELGVLTLALGEGGGTFVLNKQAPTRQIWLSSPQSGPSHYSFCQDTQCWIDERSGKELLQFLQGELQHCCTGLDLLSGT